MYKLPLLFSQRPSLGRGPTVMLAQGIWKIEGNHKDSEIMIALPSGDSIRLGSELVISANSRVSLEVTKSGTEKELTIFAVRQ